MDKTETEEINDLKLALLNFIVTEIRGHAEQLGPLSRELQDAIRSGVKEAIGTALSDFETRRLDGLAQRLEGPITHQLDIIADTLVDKLTKTLATNLSTAVQRVHQDATAMAKSIANDAVQERLDGNPTIIALVGDLNRRLARLATSVVAAVEGRPDEAHEAARAAASDVPDVSNAPRRELAIPTGKRRWSVFASLSGGQIAALVGALVLAVTAGFLAYQVYLAVYSDPLAAMPVKGQLTEVSAQAASVAGAMRKQAAQAEAFAAILGSGADAEKARRLAATIKGQSDRAGRLADDARQDLEALNFLSTGGDVPEPTARAGRERETLRYLKSLQADNERQLMLLAKTAGPARQNLHTLANSAIAALDNAKADLDEKLPQGSQGSADNSPAAKKAAEDAAKESARLKALSDRVIPVRAALVAARDAEDWNRLWAAIGQGAQLAKEIESEPPASVTGSPL